MINKFIIDCSGLAYRSHYGHPTLTRPDGALSGAFYGFINSMIALKKRFSNAHFVYAWDSGSTRKKGIYAGYKSGRNSVDIKNQINDLKAILKGLNVTQVWADGEEADDVIASYVEKNDGIRYVYSSDKDMLQLVRDGKVVVIRSRPGMEEVIYDEETVKQEYGVPPQTFAFYQALRGDSTDSIPGIPRVPSKILSVLASKYGNIINFYNGLQNEKLTDYQRDAILKFSESMKINIQLVELRKDLEYNQIEGEINEIILNTCLNLYGIKKISSDGLVNVFKNEGQFNNRESFAIKTCSVF